MNSLRLLAHNSHAAASAKVRRRTPRATVNGSDYFPPPGLGRMRLQVRTPAQRRDQRIPESGRSASPRPRSEVGSHSGMRLSD